MYIVPRSGFRGGSRESNLRRGGGGGGGDNFIYDIVRTCVPNGPLLQRCQVYDWPPFFNKKYTTDPIFLDSDILVNAYIFFA